MAQVLAQLRAHVQTVTPCQALGVAAGAVLTVSGLAGQLIVLNKWLETFASDTNGPFTVLTLVSITMALGYGSVLAVRSAISRPRFAFLRQKRNIFLLVGTGVLFACNGVFTVIATEGTPEVVQAMLIASGIIWTFLLTVAANKFRGACVFFNPFVIVSFLLCAGGIVISMADSFGHTSHKRQPGKWTAMFALAQFFGSAVNVTSALFLRGVLEPSPLPRAALDTAEYLDDVSLAAAPAGTTDPATAKLSLIAFSATAQALTMFALFPLSFTPGFQYSGHTPLAKDSLTQLVNGYKCVFFGCGTDTFLYFLGFAGFFAANMIGTALLNRYSAPLTTMISQLSAPVSAIVLTAAPALQSAGNSTPSIAFTVPAVFVLTLGIVLYSLWEQLADPHAHLVAAARGTSDAEPILGTVADDAYTAYSDKA